MSRPGLSALLFAVTAIAASSPARAQAPEPSPPEAAAVALQVGSLSGPVLRAPSGKLSVAERARIFESRTADALRDPACTPETFDTAIEEGAPVVKVCGRELLRVTPADAAAAGLPAEALAERWRDEIQYLFAREKAALFSSRLLRGAILGILIPVLWLLAIFATRWGFQRLRSILLHPGRHRDGLTIGSVEILTPSGERRAVSMLLDLLRWGAYLVLSYAFAMSMLFLVPATATYASRLTTRLLAVSRQLGLDLLVLLPRLVLLVLLVLVLRAMLRAVDRSFARGWTDGATGRVTTASHTSAITLKILLAVAGTLAAGLLLPGPPGYALLTLAALAAVLFAIGMRDLAPDFLSGLVLFYGRIALPGCRLRAGAIEGEVVGIGPFAIFLRDAAGELTRVPHRQLTRSLLTLSHDDRSLPLLVTLEGEPDPAAAHRLLLDAARAGDAGGASETGADVDAVLAEIVDGRLVFRVTLPVRREPDSLPPAAFLERLVALASERGVAIRSAQPVTLR